MRIDSMLQPICTAAERATHAPHFEVLLRMKQADGGSVPPGAFLPAERYDLSQRLDRWVMNQAFAWLANHAGALTEPGSLPDLSAKRGRIYLPDNGV